ncbi:hypothetical protein ACJX0J_018782, partial [Zea mays]
MVCLRFSCTPVSANDDNQLYMLAENIYTKSVEGIMWKIGGWAHTTCQFSWKNSFLYLNLMRIEVNFVVFYILFTYLLLMIIGGGREIEERKGEYLLGMLVDQYRFFSSSLISGLGELLIKFSINFQNVFLLYLGQRKY